MPRVARRRWPLALLAYALAGCSLDWGSYRFEEGPDAGRADGAPPADGAGADGGASEGPDLVRNGSFEWGPSGWVSSRGALVSSVPLEGAPDGANVARVEAMAIAEGDYFTVDDGPDSVSSAPPGAAYVARAYVRAATAATVGRVARLHVREQVAESRVVNDWVSNPVVLTERFQALTVRSMPVTAGNTVGVLVSVPTASPGDVIYVDAVTLREILPR